MKIKKGFTLIELLIVIAIIGILAGTLLTIINPREQQAKARDARIKSDLSKIAQVAEGFDAEFGVYRPINSSTKIDLGTDGDDATCFSVWVREGHARGSLPKDPDGNSYKIRCEKKRVRIKGKSDGDWWHYSSVDGKIHEGDWHW